MVHRALGYRDVCQALEACDEGRHSHKNTTVLSKNSLSQEILLLLTHIFDVGEKYEHQVAGSWPPTLKMLPLVWHLALESEVNIAGSQPKRRGEGQGHPPGKRGQGNDTQGGAPISSRKRNTEQKIESEPSARTETAQVSWAHTLMCVSTREAEHFNS